MAAPLVSKRPPKKPVSKRPPKKPEGLGQSEEQPIEGYDWDNTESNNFDNALDVEIRSDMDPILSGDNISRLGFDTEQLEVDNFKKTAAYWPHDDTVRLDTSVAGSEDVLAHETRHRGLRQLSDYRDEDPEFFKEKYGNEAFVLLNTINSGKEWNEWATESRDNAKGEWNAPDKDGNWLDKEGKPNKDNMVFTLEYITEEAINHFRETGKYPENMENGARLKGGMEALDRAAQDMLTKRGEPPRATQKSNEPSYWEKFKKQIGFNEGGVVTPEVQTPPADYRNDPPRTRPKERRGMNLAGVPRSKYKGTTTTSVKAAAVKAADFLIEFIPVVGDAITAKEVWNELQEDEPNYYMVGALGGAALVGLIPGLGDAASVAIRKGAKEVFDVAKRVEVNPNKLGSMGGNISLVPKPKKTTPPRFNKEALEAAAKQNDKSREILVEMPIEDFLNSAEKGTSASKLKGTRALVEAGKPFDSIPQLTFKNNGNGTGIVVGHDGRHRAMALREQGEDTIPVVLTSQAGDGPSIRWGQQNDKTSRDYVSNLPTKLIGEDGVSKVSMPTAATEIRTTKQRYAQGGVVDQMDNMNKEDGQVDPVSGNEIPVGSTAKGVRDDIDAKLSEGEYVVPADVVQYFGVAHFEKLREKAKGGLADMEADGRIGGGSTEDIPSPAAAEGYAKGGLVEGADIDSILDRVKAAAIADSSIANMLKAKGIFVQPPVGNTPPAMEGKDKPRNFAEGGAVTDEAGIGEDISGSFNPYAHTPGFSIGSGAPYGASGAPYGDSGVGSRPAPVCPDGYVWDPVTNTCAIVQETPQDVETQSTTSSKYKEDSRENNQNRLAGEDAGTTSTKSWSDNWDYSPTAEQSIFDQSMAKIKSMTANVGYAKKGAAGLGALVNPALGLATLGITKAIAINNVAQLEANIKHLEAQGLTEQAKELRSSVDVLRKEHKIPDFVAKGKNYYEDIKALDTGSSDPAKPGLGVPSVKDKTVSSTSSTADSKGSGAILTKGSTKEFRGYMAHDGDGGDGSAGASDIGGGKEVGPPGTGDTGGSERSESPSEKAGGGGPPGTDSGRQSGDSQGSHESAGAVSGGRNKGGLVTRRVKLKAKPKTKKTKK